MRRVPSHHKSWNEHYPDDKIVTGDGYVIHHIDKNPKNNAIYNLCKMKFGEHTTHHHSGLRHTDEARNRISESKTGGKHTEDSKKKMSDGHKGLVPWNKGKSCPQLSGENNGFHGKHHSESTLEKLRAARAKQSDPRLGKRHSEETKKKISDSKLKRN